MHILIKLYFTAVKIQKVVCHCSDNISCISRVKLDVLCFLHWLPWAHFSISNARNFLISGQKHKVWLFIFLVRSQGTFLVIKWSGFAEIFTFSTASVVSALAVIAHYETSSLIWYNMRTCMMSFSAKKSVTLKIVYNKKKIQIFGMNTPFISSHQARKCIFHLWLRHSWNMHFSLHSIK